MSDALRALLLALALAAASAAVAVVALFALAFTAGPTVAGGERAAAAAGVIDAALALAAGAAFWAANRRLALAPRLFATVGFLVLEAALLAAVFVFTLVLLNR